jgi:copper chaperone CopZ
MSARAAPVLTCRVPDMTSRGSVRAVTARLLGLTGVLWVQADPATALVTVSGSVQGAEVQRALTEIGYSSVEVR